MNKLENIFYDGSFTDAAPEPTKGSGLMGLVTYSAMDEYLTQNPSTFFKISYEKHKNFVLSNKDEPPACNSSMTVCFDSNVSNNSNSFGDINDKINDLFKNLKNI